MNLDLNPQPKKDNRQLAIGLAVAAAVLLLFAAFSRSWVARPAPMDVGFGPMGARGVGEFIGSSEGKMSNGEFVAKLREMSPSDADKITSSAFAPMGWATFGLLLIAALALLATAGIAVKDKRPELAVSPASISLLAIMVSLITACVFVATKPGGPGFVGVAMGFWAYGLGAVLAIVSAQMLAKAIRPIDPDLLDGAMSPEQY